MKRRHSRGILRVLLIVLAFAAALVLVYFGGRWLETKDSKPEERGDYTLRESLVPTVTYGEKTYRQKKNLTTILLIGVDKNSDETTTVSRRNGGQADMLQLVIIDSEAKTVGRLAIDRDTMTPITILGVLGDKSGVRTEQISLSHGFGDGGAESCELTVDAVSNLLLGISIDHYMAMNMDGISELNDLVGGVTVTIGEDLTNLDPAMVAGATITLQGKQAESYVRARMSVGSGTNEERMARQEQYFSGLIPQLDAKLREEKNNTGLFYDQLSQWLTTDISRGRLINIVWGAKDYERLEPYSISGTHSIGSDGFMEFHPDEDALSELVLRLFYEEVQVSGD